MTPNFDEEIDRRGTHCSKWDMMEPIYGVPAASGIAMWVADMDFRPPACVQAALESMAAHGVYGNFGHDRAYREAICWGMRTRHGGEGAAAPGGVDGVGGGRAGRHLGTASSSAIVLVDRRVTGVRRSMHRGRHPVAGLSPSAGPAASASPARWTSGSAESWAGVMSWATPSTSFCDFVIRASTSPDSP